MPALGEYPLRFCLLEAPRHNVVGCGSDKPHDDYYCAPIINPNHPGFSAP
ncbi:hypothetical protein GFS60_08039 (plasmid) [Rhodococcus sp. WAY2]|nr:hypothetical protein GFS60_08039 [Rhodococcus sp. WAY2]